MSSFKEWYAKPENRAAFNAKRKEKYANDPALRQKYQQRQAEYRTRVAGERPPFQGFSRTEVCEELGITTWVFNCWRGKNYFPSPNKVVGRVCITEHQRNLIGLIAEFHKNHGPKFSATQRAQLNHIIEVVHQNWE